MYANLRAAALAAALLVGCGGPKDHVQAWGKVVKAGGAYRLAEARSLRVAFHPDGDVKAAGRVYAANFNREDGTFTVPGLEGYGVPKGKYRVEVVENPRSGSLKGKEKVGRQRVDDDFDYLEGRYKLPGSPFVFDLDGTTELTIDLDKPGTPPAAAVGRGGSVRNR